MATPERELQKEASSSHAARVGDTRAIEAGRYAGLAGRAPTGFHWTLFCLLLAVFVGMRVLAVNGSYAHPDEVIPVQVVQQMRSAGTLDTNWADAALPEQFKYPQYNFSGYLVAAFMIDLPRCVSKERLECFSTRLIALRLSSVVAFLLALWPAYLLAARLGNAWTGMLAVAATGWSVQLFQDSIYARPEAFCTVLFLWWVVGLLSLDPSRRSYWLVTGVLAGFLISIKISFLPLVAIVPAWAVAHGVWSPNRTNFAAIVRQRAWTALAGLGATAAGFALGAPGALGDPHSYVKGVEYLMNQYASGHWPHGLADSTRIERLAHGVQFLIATLGPVVIALVGIATWSFARRLSLPALAMLALCCSFVLPFIVSAAFFERNFSHVLPLVFVLAAVGGHLVHQRVRGWCSPVVTAGLSIAIAGAALYPLAEPTLALRYRVIDGEFYAQIDEIHERLAAGCGCRLGVSIGPLGDPTSYRPASLKPDWTPAPDSDVIVPVVEYGDPESRKLLTAMRSLPGVSEVAYIEGPFTDVPLSSLHIYHGPNVRYLRVSGAVVQALAAAR